MSIAFAVYTSDPNLLRCELDRLSPEVALGAGSSMTVGGVGWYLQDQVLIRRFPSHVLPKETPELWQGVESEALAYHADELPLGSSFEENTQPYRARSWLFTHDGKLEGYPKLRRSLLASLPEHLQRQILGETAGEAAFAVYLSHLRESGRTDDPHLDATLAASLLGKTVRTLEQLSAEAGATRTSTLNFIATNGRMLVATRHGDAPLLYRLLEGSSRCERCGLTGNEGPTDRRLMAHLRRRSVAIASHVVTPTGWQEIPADTALAVDGQLNVQRLGF
jgi:glutamine amidotransferase